MMPVDHARRSITGVNEMKWNEMNEMCECLFVMKFVTEENGRNPETNLFRLRFVHHETHIDWLRRELGTQAVEVERLTLTRSATDPPQS